MVTESIKSVDIQSGMKVLHSGEFHEVADAEVSCHIVRVATIEGGHVAFTVACNVMVRGDDGRKNTIPARLAG